MFNQYSSINFFRHNLDSLHDSTCKFKLGNRCYCKIKPDKCFTGHDCEANLKLYTRKLAAEKFADDLTKDTVLIVKYDLNLEDIKESSTKYSPKIIKSLTFGEYRGYIENTFDSIHGTIDVIIMEDYGRKIDSYDDDETIIEQIENIKKETKLDVQYNTFSVKETNEGLKVYLLRHYSYYLRM